MHEYTPLAQQVMTLANKEAIRLKHNYIGTEHVLLGLIGVGKGVAVIVLERMGIFLDDVRAEIEKQIGVGSGYSNEKNIPVTPRVKKVLILAAKEAKSLNHNYVGTEHILLGLLREGEGIAARLLRELNLDVDQTRNEILLELDPNYEAPPVEPTNNTTREDTSKKDTKTPALKAFGRDLTEMARKGEIDPVIGRENEIERVIQILCRRTKNNPILIGEAGVGKTAVVEGLAHEISTGNVPEILRDKRIITLDLALMVAGTKYRGQFEERIKSVMDEIRKVKNVVLFIDEIHTMVGAGAAEGAMDASNIIKPALSRGELQCVGATTLNEFRKSIEKDAALERRFQQVKVEAPSVEQSIKILKGLRDKYETHHRAKYTEKALESAVYLSDRYLSNRFLPDKAIDIMDEAGARARILATSKPEKAKELEDRISMVCTQKETAIRSQDFEHAAALKKDEQMLRDQLQAFLKQHRQQQEQVVSVDDEDIMYVLSKWTGVPLCRMNQCEIAKLLNMEQELKEQVIGQSEAVVAVSKALRRSRADLKDPDRPIGSFIFLGPTGVGKTFLAQCLAEHMFGDRDALIQIDMSEYMEKFNTSRLIGSPPGYIGHEEGGQLSEAVRRRPYSVVLFDEIEKAHPDVMNLLLQILEEGKITDSIGRKIDFRNTIIILTSNIGANLIKKQVSMGFGAASKDESGYDDMRVKILDEAKRVLKPEFINRLDDLIVFHTLERKELEVIVDLEISKVCKRIQGKDISIRLSQSAKDLLIEHGYDPAYGARPMRRAVERHLEDPMAEEILRGNLKAGDNVEVTQESGKLVFTPSKRKAQRKKNV